MTQHNNSQDNWRSEITSHLQHVANSIDDFVDVRWNHIKSRMGWTGQPVIQPYIGYANRETGWIHGRILTNPPSDMPGDDDDWWDNLLSMYRRFASDEVPGVTVEAEVAGNGVSCVSDKEGYFFHEFPLQLDSPPSDGWLKAAMRIVGYPDLAPDSTLVSSKLLLPSPTAKLGIISDVDDTVLHTGITGLLTAAKLTFLNNAKTRKPLAGVASLYRTLQNGPSLTTFEQNPIFYISSSAWNLFDLLEDFLYLNQIPMGPILLRDLGFDADKFFKEGHEHKLRKAIRIMDTYPDLPFVFFGDSGQEDAWLYLEAARQKPDQVQAIFIRDVDPGVSSVNDQKIHDSLKQAQTANIEFHFVEDSLQAAAVLAEMGLIPESQLSAIARDVERDESIVEIADQIG